MTIKVAVLDDYLNFAEPIFKKLDAAKFEVTIFRDTLLPYAHPNTPQDEKDKLIERLQPFPVICTQIILPQAAEPMILIKRWA